MFFSINTHTCARSSGAVGRSGLRLRNQWVISAPPSGAGWGRRWGAEGQTFRQCESPVNRSGSTPSGVESWNS